MNFEPPYADAKDEEALDKPPTGNRKISLASYPVSKGYIPKALKKKE